MNLKRDSSCKSKQTKGTILYLGNRKLSTLHCSNINDPTYDKKKTHYENQSTQYKNNGTSILPTYHRSDATDVGLISIASTCPFLSAISLWNCYSVSDGGLEILTKSCKSLKEVYLGGCENITDKGILSLNQNCRQLRTLQISWCQKIHGVGLQGISPTLTCLEFKNYVWDPVLYRIFSEGSLEYLSICISVPYDSYLRQAEIDLGFASNLKILDFRNCKRVGDNTIKKISMGCPMLKEWNLSFCDNVRLPGWEWIGFYCQSLERLHVHNCRNFCDQGLLALGNGCRLLSVIYMSDCRQITPSGIQAFKTQREDVEISDIQLTTIAPSWAFTFRGQENQLKLKDSPL
uniref:F-box/LRR-repeat protein 12-like n=1 Tax=Erigeron canadensis TaxID=72917 RepID=UPI001CB8DF19|nr:F-box/LRR-repeat protein 12-like [Erigeron canadensis]